MKDLKVRDERAATRYAAEMIFAAITVPETARADALDQAFAVVVDVSPGGMRVATPQPPPLHCNVRVRVALDEHILEVDAYTIWIQQLRQETHFVGLEFATEGEEAEAFLRDFAAAVRPGAPTRAHPEDRRPEYMPE